jgi:hypothetical protein
MVRSSSHCTVFDVEGDVEGGVDVDVEVDVEVVVEVVVEVGVEVDVAIDAESSDSSVEFRSSREGPRIPNNPCSALSLSTESAPQAANMAFFIFKCTAALRLPFLTEILTFSGPDCGAAFESSDNLLHHDPRVEKELLIL